MYSGHNLKIDITDRKKTFEMFGLSYVLHNDCPYLFLLIFNLKYPLDTKHMKTNKIRSEENKHSQNDDVQVLKDYLGVLKIRKKIFQLKRLLMDLRENQISTVTSARHAAIWRV